MHPALQIVRDRFTNKDTAFTEEERRRYGIVGWFPYRVETLEDQVHRCEAQFDELAGDALMQWIFLSRLQEQNETLFYALVSANIKKMLPVVYTPTVGAACTRYSEIWRSAPRGLYLNRDMRGHIREVLDSWPYEAQIIVCTDGTRILGLGDLGAGGHQICVGKLALYTLGGGFNPRATLPISLDFGCAVEKIREGPFYLGRRETRIKDEVYYAMVEELILAVKDKWPTCVFQFEDFSNDTAFDLLARHRRHGLAVFNDDITGTGCVAAGVATAALRAASLHAGRKVTASEQRVVMLGAGAGGIGVAERIASLMETEGLTPEQARERFWLVDSQGLITRDRADFKSGRMPAQKLPWARADSHAADFPTLQSVVDSVHPTILLGMSTIGGSFTREIVSSVARACTEYPPLIMALSNPTQKAECTAQQCYDYAEGHCFYASGSPFPAVTLADGRSVSTSQCNNLYVFPGIGLGASVCQASEITDSMISAVSIALAEMVDESALRRGELTPDISDIRNISAHCALSLARQAERENVARAPLPADDDEALERVRAAQWVPKY